MWRCSRKKHVTCRTLFILLHPFCFVHLYCVAYVSYCIVVVSMWAWWGGPDGIEAWSFGHCWLGHLTRKKPVPIWPIMCWWDVKPYSINHCVALVCTCILADVRPSVCLSVCLSSVTFVHPTQAIEIFGNVSTPCGTLAILDLCIKILRRSSQGNTFVEGLNLRGLAKYSDFRPFEGYIS